MYNITIRQLILFLFAVLKHRWVWSRNSSCKYVTIYLDTRGGATVKDRDGGVLGYEDLMHQYSGVVQPSEE